MSDHPYVKVSRRLSPYLRLFSRGSTANVYLWSVLNQDEHGVVDVDVDRDNIMADTGLGKGTIDAAFDNLQAARLIHPAAPRNKGCDSYSLSGDFSRFYRPGAPTGHGDLSPALDGSYSTKKSFSQNGQKSFSAPHSSSSDPESLTDLKNQEKEEQQLQLPLPLAGKDARAEKTFLSEVSPFEVYAQEIGSLTPFIGEKLGMWIDELGPDAVVEAIHSASRQNVRKMSYIEGALRKMADARELEQRMSEPRDFSDVETPAFKPAETVPASPEQMMWDVALGELKLQLPREAFDTWLRGAKLIAHEDGTYIVGAANSYARDWLEHRLKKVIVRTLGQIAKQAVEVSFVVIDPVTEVGG